MDDIKPVINYDHFSHIDIRVGTITFCENVEKSDKLLKLEVDFGALGTREILTGMAPWYAPEEFVGLQTLFLINLEPRKMMGLKSAGMMLSVGTSVTEKPVLIKLDEVVNNGERIS